MELTLVIKRAQIFLVGITVAVTKVTVSIAMETIVWIWMNVSLVHISAHLLPTVSMRSDLIVVIARLGTLEMVLCAMVSSILSYQSFH